MEQKKYTEGLSQSGEREFPQQCGLSLKDINVMAESFDKVFCVKHSFFSFKRAFSRQGKIKDHT